MHILFWNKIILNVQYSSCICQAETGFLRLYFGMLKDCLISTWKLPDARKFELALKPVLALTFEYAGYNTQQFLKQTWKKCTKIKNIFQLQDSHPKPTNQPTRVCFLYLIIREPNLYRSYKSLICPHVPRQQHLPVGKREADDNITLESPIDKAAS